MGTFNPMHIVIVLVMLGIVAAIAIGLVMVVVRSSRR
jgi:hypothetical protein